MTAFAKSWRRDLLPLGGLRLLHLLHQRAFGFRQRLKCLVRRDRGNKLVIVPCPPGFRRLLHLIQIHLVDHPAVLSDLPFLAKKSLMGAERIFSITAGVASVPAASTALR